MQSGNYGTSIKPRPIFRWPQMTSGMSNRLVQLGVVILISVAFGLAVVIATEDIKYIKLLVGLIGGLAYVFVTFRWPEFGILGFVALLSGMISMSWLPVLHMGPVSLNISDVMLMVLLGVVFLRATTQKSFRFIGSPLMLPLFLFIAAFFLSAANALILHGVYLNYVFRTVRVLSLWVVFFPTLQLIRDEKALRRLLIGLVVFSGFLLIGILFPNRFEPLLYIEEYTASTGTQVYAGFTRLYYNGDMVLYAMIPVMVAALAMAKKGKQLWRIGLLALLLYWVFKTFFRQYWLTLFVVCTLILAFLSSRERIRLLKRMLPAAAVGALIVIALMISQPARVERTVNVFAARLGSLLQDPFARERSLQWRVSETRYALVKISQYPILGIGLANSYRPPLAGETEAMYSGWASRYIENGYLYIALTMGLVGLLPFLWLCAAYLGRVVRHQHEIQDDWLRAVYLGFGAAFLGMAACNVATPTFVIGPRLVFFPVAMAISEIILRVEREKRARQ